MRSGKRSRDNTSEETRRSQRVVTSKRLTWDEIRTHTSQDSCWIVLNDKAYDVTPFLSVHPGGKRILLGQAGKDATSMFKAIAHSTFAVEESDKYYIGDVNGERVRDVASCSVVNFLKLFMKNRAASLRASFRQRIALLSLSFSVIVDNSFIHHTTSYCTNI